MKEDNQHVPSDIMARAGLQSEREKSIAPPYAPETEAAGVLDGVGQGVTTFTEPKD
ncbi:MAG: hypothetical protein JWM16_5309 [Verrucomicrobiales bacterium]|nr:hypothetical protein [Verrucomicrobiales bacterium]